MHKQHKQKTKQQQQQKKAKQNVKNKIRKIAITIKEAEPSLYISFLDFTFLIRAVQSFDRMKFVCGGKVFNSIEGLKISLRAEQGALQTFHVTLCKTLL